MAEDRAPGLSAPRHRALTTGLVLTITFVAAEALAVVTVMPVVAHDLAGCACTAGTTTSSWGSTSAITRRTPG